MKHIHVNLKVILIVLGTCLTHATFAASTDILYTNPAIQSTTSGVQIFRIPAKDFVARGFDGQVEYIKNSNIGTPSHYIIGQTRRTNGGKNDELIILGSRVWQVWARAGNDVIIANGLKHTFSGGSGIDTIVFPGRLDDYVITGDQRWIQLTNSKNGAYFKVSSQDIEQYQFDDVFFGSEAGFNTLSVGPNKAFRKVSDAIRVAGNGDTIEVDSGVYRDDVAIIDRNITIRGVGGRAHFYTSDSSFQGKANFITMNANVTFDSVEFSGNKARDKNGAGIRMEGSIQGGTITIKNSFFHDNEVAILAGNQKNGILIIENSEFGNNGNNTSNSHTVNIGTIKELHIKNSFFHNSKNGHNVRSLADTISVEDSFFYDGTANTSFNIEVAKALYSRIIGNTFVQNQRAENTHMILNTASIASSISGNKFINNSSKGLYPINSQSKITINLNNNTLFQYKDFVGGPSPLYIGSGNSITRSPNMKLPSYSTPVGGTIVASSTPTGANTPSNPIVVIEKNGEFQSAAKLDQYKGGIITVGRGKQYSNLKDAVSRSASGDIIYVDEGIYLSDYVMIDKKNIAIIGLGKGAEFKKVKPIPNGKAIFVSYRSNVLIKNIIFSDSDVPDDNGAGIRYEGGTLTVVDSLFRNNENGILGGATEVGKGRIWIHNSRFIDNGKNATGYTHAIYIGEIDFFEIKHSTVSGTLIGHHVKSRARNNIIENNTLDDAGKSASYNIDLPNGGEALVKGNTIIQSAQSPNRNMVSYSSEKNPTNPGRLIVENNIFTSQGGSATGVKNFKNNTVILINNTFNNVSSKFSGINISEE